MATVAVAGSVQPAFATESTVADQTAEYLVAVDGDLSALTSVVEDSGGRVEEVFNELDVIAVTLSASEAAELDARSGVRVEPNITMHAFETPSFGIDRIDQRALPLSGGYSHDASSSGAGVDVYVMDTGVRADHVELSGRVASGYSAVLDGRGTADCNGHGTHVAGTVAGESVGVAPDARIIPVRVLDCQGATTTGFEYLDGVDWVLGHHQAGQPAVLNMSLGGSPSSIVDASIADLVADGVTVVAAAGNSNVDACGSSPARAPSAITVAASNITDARASYSNWGACVDLFAPGGDGSRPIYSAWSTSATQIAGAVGTSMAAPHVAGVAARYLGTDRSATPAQVAESIRASSTTGVITSPGVGTPNRLLYVLPGAISVAPAFEAAWLASGGASGSLGEPTSVERFDSGGRWQTFRGGALTQRDGAAVIAVDGEMGARYLAIGAGSSGIGLPTGSVETLIGGTRQSFQRGTLFWSGAYRAWEVDSGETGAAYAGAGGPTGTLGFPRAANRCVLTRGGCYQDFANGSIHRSPATGAHATSGTMRGYWESQGWEGGSLGYPTGDPATTAAGTIQQFERQTVYISSTGVVRTVDRGQTGAEYTRVGAQTGVLGWPTSQQLCGLRDGGCYQNFQNGSIHWNGATGAHATWSGIRSFWASQGWEGGPLGYPTNDAVTTPSGTMQQFQGQTVYLSPNGTVRTVDRGQTGAEYTRVGAQAGVLGWPVQAQRCGLYGGGCYQEFASGSIHWNSATGAHATWAGVRSYWAASGWESGVLGYPSGDAVTSPAGMVQQFQRQTLYVPAGGAAQMVDRGQTGDAYARVGAQTGVLGWPTGAQQCRLRGGACFQDFQGGSVHWSSSTGAHATSGAIRSYWASSGWEGGVLGFPSGDAVTTNGVTVQDFQGGRVRLSSGQVTFTPR